jgi:hypothetical protein
VNNGRKPEALFLPGIVFAEEGFLAGPSSAEAEKSKKKCGMVIPHWKK